MRTNENISFNNQILHNINDIMYYHVLQYEH